MLAVVTGASGHLGANLVRFLIEKGWFVRALVHRNCRALEGLPVEIAQGDILDPDSLNNAFRGVDTVFHLAARISILESDRAAVEKINVQGTVNITDACLKCAVKRLIHVSSIHAHQQQPLDEVLDESRPLVEAKNLPAYDLSKAGGERAVAEAFGKGLNTVIVNPTGMVGPFDYGPSHFGRALLAMAAGKLPALVDGGFDWVDTRDVASALITAALKAAPGSKFLLSGTWAAMEELALNVAKFTGRKPPRLVVPLGIASFGARLGRFIGTDKSLFTPDSIRALYSNRKISHDKASRELDYKPRPLSETIENTLQWFYDEGTLKTAKRAED